MAIVKKDQSTKLMLKVQIGTTGKGKDKYVQRTFATINPAVSDEDLLAAGTAFGDMQERPLNAVMRQDVCTLSQG